MIEGVRLHGGDVVRHLSCVRVKEFLQCPDAGSYDVEQQALDGNAAKTFIEVFAGAETVCLLQMGIVHPIGSQFCLDCVDCSCHITKR